ncbi:hypothetical protein ACFLT9_11260 [Acidobacteriota bacterium]
MKNKIIESLHRKVSPSLKRWFYWLPLWTVMVILSTGGCRQGSVPESDYACRIVSDLSNVQTYAGWRIEIPLTITNTGREAWLSDGQQTYALSYHILDGERNSLQYENRRFPLPLKIEPGKKIDVPAVIHAPLKEGRYFLEFDVVNEGVRWLKDSGGTPFQICLEVEDNRWSDIPTEFSSDPPSVTYFQTDLPEFNTLYTLVRLTLEKNEVAFRGKTGNISGFSAGTEYPQIWLRDANTIIPGSVYFYGSDFLSSWLEEHLAFQKKDGSLYDWIDSQGKSDKNTTETDQETSAVQAAYQIFQQLGAEWLEKEIGKQSIISRLEAALTYVYEQKRNPELGLLIGAHTADWGDVDIVDSDQRAVYTDENTHWTADIYDQSMFYLACIQIGEMMKALHQGDRADFWRDAARQIKVRTQETLWMEEMGYFRVHIHLDDLIHDFEEDDIFALGGNLLALESGLADGDQIGRIIQTALDRQKQFDVSTLGAALSPPYPPNTFKHPLMDALYEYQNGAQWDWFGVRFITALFRNGCSEIAREKLQEIANKNISNGGFFEWDNREGIGMGSDYFCGSAGQTAQALIEGYFGVGMEGNRLLLSPKLGQDSGYIHAFIPSLNGFAVYKYEFIPEETRVRMTYRSSVTSPGKIKILLPWEVMGKNEGEIKEGLMVERDGKRVDYTIEWEGERTLIIFSTDWDRHTIELSAKR